MICLPVPGRKSSAGGGGGAGQRAATPDWEGSVEVSDDPRRLGEELTVP